MRAFLIAAAIALIAVPCYAQGTGGRGKHQKQDQANQDQKKKPDDKKYKQSLSGLPDQQYDPWRGVR